MMIALKFNLVVKQCLEDITERWMFWKFRNMCEEEIANFCQYRRSDA
jgi:hypothetical protein